MSPDSQPLPPPTARTCQICWGEFIPSRSNNIYCSSRCKNTAARRRNSQTDTPFETQRSELATTPQPAATRDCPHCGEPITIVALLTTPEAARPSIPADNTIVPLHRST
ncbi:hypothetical protein [Nocardia sp. NPDC047648]|uniref:hypothetical protein n=1 Tax=Nocardia sp. NPDC047648 TaxID=3155625 RepID=UPI0033EABBA1